MSSVGCTVCWLSCLSGAVGFLVLWLDSHFLRPVLRFLYQQTSVLATILFLVSVLFQSRFSAKIKSGFFRLPIQWGLVYKRISLCTSY